jgi:transcriptional regulator with XRE-family HTH domain
MGRKKSDTGVSSDPRLQEKIRQLRRSEMVVAIDIAIGKALKEVRLGLGLSMEELARLSMTNRDVVFCAELGAVPLLQYPNIIDAIIDACGIEASHLFGLVLKYLPRKYRAAVAQYGRNLGILRLQ